MQLFSADATMFLKIFRNYFLTLKTLKKTPQKVAYLWQLGVFFFAAPTAKNSPERHFCFINSFIQSSIIVYIIRPDCSMLLELKKKNSAGC